MLPGSAVPPSRRCPEDTAGIYSYLTFAWVGKLLTVGYARQLNQDDVWRIPDNERVGPVGEKFRMHWEHELATKEQPSLVRRRSSLSGHSSAEPSLRPFLGSSSDMILPCVRDPGS